MQTINAGNSSAETNRLAGVHDANKLKWGVATNGFVGGVLVEYEGTNEARPRITVYAHLAFDTNQPEPTVDSELASTKPIMSGVFGMTDTQETVKQEDRFICIKGTNRFCGPMVLQDMNGDEISPKTPALSSFQSYPKQFGRRQATMDAQRGERGYASVPWFETLIGRMPQLAQFFLDEHFKLEKPGNYCLIIWPRIYIHRPWISETNDLCERVDMLPVSVNVNWTGTWNDNPTPPQKH
jgi:hypothetical protein